MRDWRICPRCAAGLRHGPVAGEDAPRLHCPACRLVLYENPAPTVSAVVERDGRVLLTRRGIEPRLGMRKDAGLEITDRIRLTYPERDGDITRAFTEHRDWIAAETLAVSVEPGSDLTIAKA